MTFQQNRLTRDYETIWTSYLHRERFMPIAEERRSDRESYYRMIAKHIPSVPNPVVLELGCGTGIDINLIKRSCPYIVPVGTDISFQSIYVGLRVSGEFKNRVGFMVSDVRDLPVRSNALDVVFSQGLLEHFGDPGKILLEQSRIVRGGGVILVNVPQKFTGYTLMKKRKMRKGVWKMGWETEFSYRQLREMGKAIGLAEVDVIGSQYWKTWWEPMFVLRDLYGKSHRRNPMRSFRIFKSIQKGVDAAWQRIEDKWGHLFMKNIVVVFRKR